MLVLDVMGSGSDSGLVNIGQSMAPHPDIAEINSFCTTCAPLLFDGLSSGLSI